MKLLCPKCGADGTHSAIVEGLVKCPGCEEWFAPPRPEPPPVVPRPPEEIERVEKARTAWDAASAARQQAERAEKIRSNANAFTGLAAFFGVIATLAFLLALIIGRGGENSGPSFSLVGALVAIALWLYLIAQLIHIRANTEK